MPKFMLVAISNPVEGREAECGSWYDDVHLQDMLSVPGVLSARRYERMRSAPSKAFKRYLALYELEASDEGAARAVIDTLNARNLVLADCLDVSSVNLGVFRAEGWLSDESTRS